MHNSQILGTLERFIGITTAKIQHHVDNVIQITHTRVLYRDKVIRGGGHIL